jgi:hypothetical protein
VDRAKRCLNYLYTAAFLEFVKDKLAELGHHTLEQIRQAQSSLGVPAGEAQKFYRERVDGEVDRLAQRFFEDRSQILELLNTL